MSPALESELRALSPAERILLVEEVWDRIAAEPASIPLSPEHRAELDRRLDGLDESPDHGRPWSEGRTDAGRLLHLNFTLRSTKLRIISARPMNRRERTVYETHHR